MKYAKLAELYSKVEATSKRLEKTFYVSEFLKDASDEELDMIILLLQGCVFPKWDDKKIGVAAKLVVKAINTATGISLAEIETEWKQTGDLGITAENLVKHKKQGTLFSEDLTIKKVFDNVRKLARLEGSGSVDHKKKLISELLSSAKSGEARYVIRTILEDLRVGIGEGVLRDAIVWAYLPDEASVNYDEKKKSIIPQDRNKYNSCIATIQEAYDILNDFSKVAKTAKKGGIASLQKVSIEIGKPLKLMLYQKAKDLNDAFDRVGKPAAIEYKYDGFRLQVHKLGNVITLYTRSLEDVTRQFPEVVDYVKNKVQGDVILDAEAIGYEPSSGKYVPFQKMSQRIKRKYNIELMAKDYPVELNVFDIICYQGNSVIKSPFKERRALIEKIISQEPKKIICAKQIITDSIDKANNFYQESLQNGEEGVMFKNLEGVYKPGSRVGHGVKVKPVMESLDLVIVGAEWGEGKRSGWFTSFTLACYDPDTGEFLTIGKVGTGIKELDQEGGVTFAHLTELLEPLITKESGRTAEFKPEIVIEINFEEIQKSPTYEAGYALRFPRLVRIRVDRSPEEASDIDLVEELYSTQRARR